jgi:plasmid stabilization system protein ParE
MRPALIIAPAAELDIVETIDWYDSTGPGLSSRFRSALDDTFQRIIDHPDAYAPLSRGLRRALLRRFSHGVYFRHHQQAIQVVAVLHTSRNPRIWQERSH